MAQPLYKAKAPGSLMLMGEHAVLQGKPALIAAIDRYIEVCLVPRQDSLIKVTSNLGGFEISLEGLREQVQFAKSVQFVMATIQSMQSRLALGFDLYIESEFSDTMGFGSSAAVVVATLKVLDTFLEDEAEGKSDCSTTGLQANLKEKYPNPALAIEGLEAKTLQAKLLQRAREVVLKVQGQGSGADVAASVYGGLVYYQLEQPVLPLDRIEFPNIYAVYSGYKVPTPVVIRLVQEASQAHPAVYDNLFSAIATCTENAYQACMKRDWSQFGQLMNIHHSLQAALGVSDEKLESLVQQLRNKAGIFGAKISGAGLGDCVVGIGDLGEERGNGDYEVLRLARCHNDISSERSENVGTPQGESFALFT